MSKILSFEIQVLGFPACRQAGIRNWKLDIFMRNIIYTVILVILPLIVFAQDTGKKKAYYFYGETCPHCKNVDEYFKANGIYDQYEIKKLETSNPFSKRLFFEFGEAFEDPNWGGVPVVIFENKYLLGDQPIIDNFVKEIATAEAKDFPDPDKIGGKEDVKNQENQGSQPSAKEGGNKKNIFPVILIAIVAIGAGLLIFINRKKSKA